MSLYNMLMGYNPAVALVLPMLGRKLVDYPRFRDCFITDKGNIAVYTRVGGGNRNYGYGEDELYKDENFITTYDDEYDNTYGTYEFRVPERWKADFNAIREDKLEDLSNEYFEYLREFWPKDNVAQTIINKVDQLRKYNTKI